MQESLGVLSMYWYQRLRLEGFGEPLKCCDCSVPAGVGICEVKSRIISKRGNCCRAAIGRSRIIQVSEPLRIDDIHDTISAELPDHRVGRHLRQVKKSFRSCIKLLCPDPV